MTHTTTNGTKNVAIRITNAESAFISYAMTTANLTQAEAEKVLSVYRKVKAIKIDVIGGQFTFTHGGFATAEVLQRAANQ